MRFSVTYEITTPESAEFGEAAESGFLGESLTLRDALDLVRETRTSRVDGVEAVEPNESPMTNPDWVTICNGMEYETGARESRSLHFPCEMTPASKIRVCRLLGA